MDRLYSCFVNQPSSCNDLVNSTTYPGKQLSAEPCEDENEGDMLLDYFNYSHLFRNLIVQKILITLLLFAFFILLQPVPLIPLLFLVQITLCVYRPINFATVMMIVVTIEMKTRQCVSNAV